MNIKGLFGGLPPGVTVATGKADHLERGPRAEFLAYMEKSPAERMRDTWLKAHGLSEDDLKAMAPAEREAVEQQIAADIKAQMQEDAQEQAALQARKQALQSGRITLPAASFLVLVTEQDPA